MMMQESKAKTLADQATYELQTKGGKMELEQVYKNLLQFAKFQTFRELRYLEEEQELLEFEQQFPDDARKAAEDFQLQSGSTKKPKMVQLTPHDVDRIVKNNRFVPLDTVELMKLEEQKQQFGQKEVQQNLEINQAVDFKKIDLEYGGGNPYTFQLKGENADFRDYQYNVVRTDTFYPGQPKEEEVDIKAEYQNEFAGKDYVKEENYEVNDKREWDDWVADNPAGSGNKPRNE